MDEISGNWLIGMMPVITSLWKDKVVYELITAPPKWKKGATVCSYGAENVSYLLLTWYGPK